MLRVHLSGFATERSQHIAQATLRCHGCAGADPPDQQDGRANGAIRPSLQCHRTTHAGAEWRATADPQQVPTIVRQSADGSLVTRPGLVMEKLGGGLARPVYDDQRYVRGRPESQALRRSRTVSADQAALGVSSPSRSVLSSDISYAPQRGPESAPGTTAQESPDLPCRAQSQSNSGSGPPSAMKRSIRRLNTGSGTEPSCSTVSWKARRSNLSPSACSALCRNSRIFS